MSGDYNPYRREIAAAKEAFKREYECKFYNEQNEQSGYAMRAQERDRSRLERARHDLEAHAFGQLKDLYSADLPSINELTADLEKIVYRGDVEQSEWERRAILAEERLDDARAQIKAFEEGAEAYPKVIDDLKKSEDFQRMTCEANERLCGAMHKIENDLGKVRAAIGSIRFNEIIGSKP